MIPGLLAHIIIVAMNIQHEMAIGDCVLAKISEYQYETEIIFG